MQFNLGITGASISNCPWITWVDLLYEDLGADTITNYASKGAGNEYILRSACELFNSVGNNGFVAFMCTNFDKLDLWVSDKQLQGLLSEKHQPVWIDGNIATKQGYWCTGSHFPKTKQKYGDLYKDLIPIAARQLYELAGTLAVAEQNGIKSLVMFDSPVLQYSEQMINAINNGEDLQTELDLHLHQMLTTIVTHLKSKVVDFNGLIGHCMQEKLDWRHSKYGPHPPSSSHLSYYNKHVRSWIQTRYPQLDLQGISKTTETMVERMSKKWQMNGF